MLGSEPDILPAAVETVSVFLVLSPGKRLSRVTSAYFVLPLRGAAPGTPWRRERHGTATTAGWFPLPPREGQGEGKHHWEVFYVICGFSGHCAPGESSALCHSWRRERTGGGQSPPPPVPPGSGQQNRHCVVPSTYSCRLRVGPRQRPCKTRPSARIHAGCPGLPGTSQRF